jgi:hypothetical protein
MRPQLQQLSFVCPPFTISGRCLIPCLATLSHLASLKLSLGSLHAPFHYSLLEAAFSQLMQLTHLTLKLDQVPAGAAALQSLSCLSQLRELSLAGEVEAGHLPTALTALTIGDDRTRDLPLVSGCLQLERLVLDDALLPGEPESADALWATLTPLTALRVLEGTIDPTASDTWAYIGSEEASSVSVLQRLERFCMSNYINFGDGHGVWDCVRRGSGHITRFTNLQALWLGCLIPLDVPSSVTEMRSSSFHQGDMSTWESVTSLTLDVWAGQCQPLNQLPPRLQELAIVHYDEPREICISDLAPLPYLQQLSLWDGGLSSAVLGTLFAFSPCLEHVHLYRRQGLEEVAAIAREALSLLHHKPAVSIHSIGAYGKVLHSSSVDV